MQKSVRSVKLMAYAIILVSFCLMVGLAMIVTGAHLTWPPRKQDVITFVVATGVFLAIAAYAKWNTTRMVGAQAAYRDALEKLKANPNSPQLRTAALELGRAYSNITRNQKGVTVFDEVALSNDINAACAASVLMASSSASTAVGTTEARLQKLLDLKTSGLITDEEYGSRRSKILDEL